MAQKTWSEDDIILAIWEWEEKHGKPPSFTDWRHSGGGFHPSAMTVYTRFGSFNEAIERAGFFPNPRPRRVEFDEKLAKQLRREGLSERAISRQIGVSKDVLRKRLGPRQRIVATKKRSREQRIADLRKALREEEELGEQALVRRRSPATR